MEWGVVSAPGWSSQAASPSEELGGGHYLVGRHLLAIGDRGGGKVEVVAVAALSIS